MKAVLISMLLSIGYAHSNPQPVPTSEVWSLGNQFFPMEKDQQSGSLISLGCSHKKAKCDAFRALRQEKKIALSEMDLVGGKNPGAVMCKKFFKAEIVILRDSNTNENAFCKFKDGSLVSAGALR
ncbi:MAG: hypothetical protein ACXVLQ_14015 [Bacteriovorax sp.]